MSVRTFDPAAGGQSFQGDIAIVPMPTSITVRTTDEIKPVDGRLIIQEGEITGHHHKILLPRAIRGHNFAPERQIGDPTLTTRDRKLAGHFGGGKKAEMGTARMYRDPAAVSAMQALGLLTRTDLAIGCLVIEGAPVTVTHEEHDSIELPPGNYYCGRQVESAGAEERVVAD
jgi:hypothetical protein